jgi:hypothetical protein
MNRYGTGNADSFARIVGRLCETAWRLAQTPYNLLK